MGRVVPFADLTVTLRGRTAAVLCGGLLSVAAGGVVAQSGLTPSSDPSQAPLVRFSAETQVVEVFATVTGPDGRAVRGLGAEDFEVREDGAPQAISVFNAGPFPATVALGIDRSFSMAGEPLRLARRASQAFLRLLAPGDRTMVWAISEAADLIAPIDAPRDEQVRAVAGLEPWGTTALYDSIVAALDRLEGEAGRHALVLFTDGEDRYSRARTADVLDRVRRSSALVYPIAVGKVRPPVLAELATLSGGRSFHVRDVRGLQPALASVAEELGQQYLLGYAPAPAARRGWKSITVRVKARPGARVRARDGYLVP